MLIYAHFGVNMLQIAFTRLFRQIHQSARIGGGGRGSSQSWQCQDCERFLYSHPSLKLGILVELVILVNLVICVNLVILGNILIQVNIMILVILVNDMILVILVNQ